MGNYTQLVFSDNPIAQNNLAPQDLDLYIKNMFPLFWFSLYHHKNIEIIENPTDDQYYAYYLTIDKNQGIINFKSHLNLWSVFGKRALQLANDFIAFIQDIQKQYIVLYVHDILGMSTSPDDDEAKQILNEILNIYQTSNAEKFLEAIKQNIWLQPSIQYYQNHQYKFALDGLDEEEDNL
ncbi:hypothetical protein [Acinetobacter sp. WCHAc060025]|uniref:hypothetical protein n=1 Tax=Acinetobacter sp. WCHAc060025 TaxID=2518625 RepID=UPI0010232BE3|nr:hypothetical protein [Acinetobacter sp. WCHAc060025]RZG72831.1 hypothetical protein EXE09_16315 [Acinetobacter sp. WCHAc060025]